MVWYGMVWYGMVWYGMVWCGVVWYGMVWYGMVWYTIYSLTSLSLQFVSQLRQFNVFLCKRRFRCFVLFAVSDARAVLRNIKMTTRIMMMIRYELETTASTT